MARSVYLSLCDDTGMYLVAKKRERNSWWRGRTQSEVWVNQANQWSLPGGGINRMESPEAAALREFQEETGINLSRTSRHLETRDLGLFDLVRYQCSAPDLHNIVATAWANVQPGAAVGQPINPADVKDWEVGDFQLVHGSNIKAFLGNAQAKPFGMQPHIANSVSQDIDWYAAIGDYIAALHPTP